MVLSYKGRDYVAASRAAGRSGIAILLRVILPSILPAILVMAAIDVGRAILMFSILSFLGLGARPPTPEWGSMVSEGAIVFDQWWVATFPAHASALRGCVLQSPRRASSVMRGRRQLGVLDANCRPARSDFRLTTALGIDDVCAATPYAAEPRAAALC
jgi:hypothetical protein